MQQNDIENYLKNMVGRHFTYRCEEHKVQKTWYSAGSAHIITDKDMVEIQDADIEMVETQFVPFISSKNGIVKHQPFTSLIKAETPNLIRAITDDIEKLKHNKEYIQQAQARRNNVESLIKLARLELDVYKTLEKAQA